MEAVLGHVRKELARSVHKHLELRLAHVLEYEAPTQGLREGGAALAARRVPLVAARNALDEGHVTAELMHAQRVELQGKEDGAAERGAVVAVVAHVQRPVLANVTARGAGLGQQRAFDPQRELLLLGALDLGRLGLSERYRI